MHDSVASFAREKCNTNLVFWQIGAGLYCKMALALRSVQVRLLERFNLTKPSMRRRAFHVVSICLATAIITFPFGIMRISDRLMVNELFRDQELSFLSGRSSRTVSTRRSLCTSF